MLRFLRLNGPLLIFFAMLAIGAITGDTTWDYVGFGAAAAYGCVCFVWLMRQTRGGRR